MLRDLVLADMKGFPLLLPVVLHHPAVILGSQPHHGTQGLHDGLVLHLVIPPGTGSKFHPLRGLDDHLVPQTDGRALWVKIIILASVAETDADYLGQKNPSNSTARPPST